MYTITNDFQNFIQLNDKQDAIAVANIIKGVVYITSHMLEIYSYEDRIPNLNVNHHLINH